MTCLYWPGNCFNGNKAVNYFTTGRYVSGSYTLTTLIRCFTNYLLSHFEICNIFPFFKVYFRVVDYYSDCFFLAHI